MTLVTVTYHEKGVYRIPDKIWQKAVSRCGGNEKDALDLILNKGEAYTYFGDIDGWRMEVAKC